MSYEELAQQFRKVVHSLHKQRQKIDVSGSIQGGAFILQYLYQRKEAVLPSEISNEMEISSARTAAALNNLENKGYINREINKNDRRQILVTLSPEGKQYAAEQHEKITSGSVSLLKSLGENDAKELIRILTRISDLMKQKNDEIA